MAALLRICSLASVLSVLSLVACGPDVVGGGGAGPGGADAGCNGSPIPYCSGGQIGSYCCPPGAPCAAPQAFCDMGGGACVSGMTCADLDSGAPCAYPPIEAAHYDQSCAGDADCAAVFQGTPCGACFCPNAAISQKALPTYESDFAASGPHGNVCDCTLIPTPACQGGVCALP